MFERLKLGIDLQTYAESPTTTCMLEDRRSADKWSLYVQNRSTGHALNFERIDHLLLPVLKVRCSCSSIQLWKWSAIVKDC